MKGEDLLIMQLIHFKDMEYTKEKEEVEAHFCEMAERLNIPTEYEEAFYAYAHEYLQEPYGCMQEDGCFWDGHDVMIGIWDKFYSFYQPIITANVPTYHDIVIDPSYEGRTRIIAYKDSKIFLKESTKAWNFYFASETELLKYLEEIAHKMRNVAETTAELNYNDIFVHIGHELKTVQSKDGKNVAIECDTCRQIIATVSKD